MIAASCPLPLHRHRASDSEQDQLSSARSLLSMLPPHRHRASDSEQDQFAGAGVIIGERVGVARARVINELDVDCEPAGVVSEEHVTPTENANVNWSISRSFMWRRYT